MHIPAEVPADSHVESCLRVACLLEAAARKPGNVHPQASFRDLRYEDFVGSAEVAAPILSRAKELGVGRAVFEAARETHRAVGRNTNLGILLLLAPLAAVPNETSLPAGIDEVLKHLTREDASFVYRAIRLMTPGGLGRVAEQDVSGEPTATLLDVMQLAAERDSVAAQYATGFHLVLHLGVPVLVDCSNSWAPPNRPLAVGADGESSVWAHWEEAIVRLHLELMAQAPDTLIARKCGRDEALRSAELAREVLEAGWPRSQQGRKKLEAFDHWLRDEHHRRNPGTTADLVTACLFAALRDRHLVPPQKIGH